MKRFFFAAVILSIALSRPAFAGVNEPATAKEWYEQYGQRHLIDGGIAAASTPGTLWNNGPNNLFDSLSSEADTLVTGTGGPEGDHGSTVADDFLLTLQYELTEIRVCFFSDAPTAELYIYADDGGMPGPSVTAPVFGGPTTASVVTTTYNDNTARCQPAFGYPGREYVFNASTTGVTLPTLAAGRYWLAVVGRGPGSPNNRAFWAGSSPSNPLLGGVWGSTNFGEPYWSPANSDFAFDIDGRRSATAVPALTDWGILIVTLLSGFGAIHRLRRQSKAGG